VRRLTPLILFILFLFLPVPLNGQISRHSGSSNQEAAQNLSPPSWTEFKPQDGGFSILMLSSPASNPDTIKLDSSTVSVTEYDYTTGQTVYLVLRLGDFQENYLDRKPVAEWFDWASRLLLEYTNEGKPELPKIFEQRDLSLDKYPGRLYETECGPYKKGGSESCEVSLRIYKVERSIYIIGLVRPKASLPANQVNRYFGSFKLESDRVKGNK
jgi:hypothetical protein